MRTLLNTDPFAKGGSANTANELVNTWPAKWVRTPFPVATPAQVAFRCRFTIETPTPLRLHVSADERYHFFLDGQPVGRGPDYGDQENWYFDTYDLALAAGDHILVATVLMLGDHRPTPQMSLAHGLLVCPDPGSLLVPLIATGVAQWSCKLLGGYTIGQHAWNIQATGPMTLDAHQFPWGYETGKGDGWSDALDLHEAAVASVGMTYERSTHLLRPAVIPPQIDCEITGVSARHVSTIPDFADDQHPFDPESDLINEHSEWSQGTLTVPANTIRRVLIEFDNYYSFYYGITVSGGCGAKIRVTATERLVSEKTIERPWEAKVRQDRIEGTFFNGLSDQFILDGGSNRKLEPFWWRCGRYVQIVVAAGNEPLAISSLEFRETRYPLELQSSFTASDGKLEQILALCFRTLQECCHDIYVDCPYYEQVQWVGDMRIQILCHYVATSDVRQVKKALSLINNSAALGGFVRAFYPSDGRLLIPGFALWYIACAYDLALWRGEKEFVQTLMPQVRATMDAILQNTREDGLIKWPQGWPYTDWADGFSNGNPPAGEERTESIFNFQVVHVLNMLGDLESYLGEEELAARCRRKAQHLADACSTAFWDDARGLFAIDLSHTHFSEHSQCLAVLSERITPQQQASIADKLISDPSITRVQIFYSHYLFETYRKLDCMDALFARMEPWYKMLEMGLKTVTETVPNTRSDCHAWSAHPLMHFYTTILGIRPASMEFATVEIEPKLGPLGRAAGKLIHPRGYIEVEFFHSDGTISGDITLPEGVTGTAKVNGQIVTLHSGKQTI